MSDKKISELNNAGPLTGDELVPVVQGGQTVKTTLNDITSTETFDEDFTVILAGNKSFGKYTNGQLVPAEGKTAREVILDAAIEFVFPTSSFSISSMGGTGLTSGDYAEKGSTVTSVNMSYGAVLNSDTLVGRTILRGGDVADVIANVPLSSSFNKLGLSLVWTTPLLERTFTYTVDYGTSIDQIITDDVKFVAPSFYGVGSASLLDPVTTIAQLTAALPSSKELRLGKAKSNVNFNPVLQRYFFVYPASFGDLTTIIDQNGFNVTASYTKTTKSILLADGITSETYNLYISNADTTQVNFKQSFS